MNVQTETVTNRTQAAALRTRLIGELRRELREVRATAEDTGDAALAERVARLEGAIAQVDSELQRLSDRAYIAEIERDAQGLMTRVYITPTP